MTPEKILRVIEIYRKFFADNNIGKKKYPYNKLIVDRAGTGLGHCHSMLDEMTEFVREGRIEKAFRWLGFIQGILWLNGVYTLTDLKNHNRPITRRKRGRRKIIEKITYPGLNARRSMTKL